MENATTNCAKITDKNQTAAAATPAQNSVEKILEKNLHEEFVKYGANAKEWLKKCAFLLPEIARLRIWEKREFSSIYEYAAKLAGMSRSSVDDALWLVRKVEDKPALKRIAEEKGINIIKPIAGIVTAENAEFWAEKANGMSKSALEAYVREFKKLLPGEQNYYENQDLFSGIKTEQIIMDLEPEIADQFKKLKGNGNWNDLAKKLLEAYKAQIEAEKPAAVQSESRYVPAKIERYALAKTASTCAFPGCTKPYEILHHTVRFSLTHTHNPDQLAPLCKAHEQLAHLGLIENEENSPSEWRIKKLPDETAPKYKIDQEVLKYRMAGG